MTSILDHSVIYIEPMDSVAWLYAYGSNHTSNLPFLFARVIDRQLDSDDDAFHGMGGE
jgi:hypothetical protein